MSAIAPPTAIRPGKQSLQWRLEDLRAARGAATRISMVTQDGRADFGWAMPFSKGKRPRVRDSAIPPGLFTLTAVFVCVIV